MHTHSTYLHTFLLCCIALKWVVNQMVNNLHNEINFFLEEQSHLYYEIESPPCTIWWFRILGIFSVENIDAVMFQTSDNSQLCIDSQYSSQQLTIVWSLIHHSTQPILLFSRARVLHLDRLKEGTWLHSFATMHATSIKCTTWQQRCSLHLVFTRKFSRIFPRAAKKSYKLCLFAKEMS